MHPMSNGNHEGQKMALTPDNISDAALGELLGDEPTPHTRPLMIAVDPSVPVASLARALASEGFALYREHGLTVLRETEVARQYRAFMAQIAESERYIRGPEAEKARQKLMDEGRES